MEIFQMVTARQTETDRQRL